MTEYAPCPHCGKRFKVRTGRGMCAPCFRTVGGGCPRCGKPGEEGRRHCRRCLDDKRRRGVIRARLPSHGRHGPQRRPPWLEARIREYAARAALGLPLFAGEKRE